MSTLARLTAALADRYRLDRELGAGGMATVYAQAAPRASRAGTTDRIADRELARSCDGGARSIHRSFGETDQGAPKDDLQRLLPHRQLLEHVNQSAVREGADPPRTGSRRRPSADAVLIVTPEDNRSIHWPQMNAPEAFIQFKPGLIAEEGEVTVASTEEFLRTYVEAFHAFIGRHSSP